MKYEWKKQEKEFYGAKKSPALVTVPAQNYIMIGGKGNPNDVDFQIVFRPCTLWHMQLKWHIRLLPYKMNLTILQFFL